MAALQLLPGPFGGIFVNKLEAANLLAAVAGQASPGSQKEGWYEKLYNMLWRNIPFSLILIDPSLRVTSANWNFIEKARRSQANTLGMRIRDIFPDAILEFTQLEAKIRSVFETGLTLPGANMTYRAPGIPMRVYFYTVIPIKSGRVVEHAMLVLDDVTEKVQMSAKARMDERYLASVVESANDLVISTDPQGFITSWNPAAERISGYRIELVRGRLLSELCQSSQGKDLEAIIHRLVHGGVVDISELNLIAQSGVLIPVDWSFSPIFDDAGKISGMVAVGRDLSERRALEKHLYQTEKLAALGVMAGGIAHELRNPLSVSFSAAQFLLDPSADPAFRQVCVEKILEGIDRSSMIIENLLRFARPSSGNHTEAVNLITLVSETVKILLPQAKLQKINLVEAYALSQVPIVGNANLLQQVIMNLVLNAFQAMPDGGDVVLAVRLDQDDALVSVQDAGAGILATDIERIFDPFFTTRPAGQGTGLGLSICHTIVKQHLGSISALSNVKAAGTTFIVRLPLAIDQ